jgi:hypothetical protein
VVQDLNDSHEPGREHRDPLAVGSDARHLETALNNETGDESYICDAFDVGDWEGLVVLRVVLAQTVRSEGPLRSPCYLIDPAEARAVAARLCAAADMAEAVAPVATAGLGTARH